MILLKISDFNDFHIKIMARQIVLNLFMYKLQVDCKDFLNFNLTLRGEKIDCLFVK